jgi:hypothetical protein
MSDQYPSPTQHGRSPLRHLAGERAGSADPGPSPIQRGRSPLRLVRRDACTRTNTMTVRDYVRGIGGSLLKIMYKMGAVIGWPAATQTA